MNYRKSILSLSIAAITVGLSACGGSGSTTPVTTPTAADPYKVSDWFNAGANNRLANPALESNGQPGVASPDLQDAAYAINLGGNFVATDYLGAFPQDTNDNWTAGWTVWLNGNNTVWQPAVTPLADATCPTGTTYVSAQTLPVSVGGGQMDLCQLDAVITTDVSLSNDNIYKLASGFPGTKVGLGEDLDATNDVAVTLTIAPGTLIMGDVQEALVITRDARIDAQGTAAGPIVMTSKTQFDAWVAGGDGTSGRGEWAGLALMGHAPTNECGSPCDVAAEGNIGYYGGTDNADNSGIIRYLVIRHAGNDIDGNGNELNGLTLFGTGSATRVDYVQIHKNLDDGVEHFGSNDFMSHLVLTANKDDSFDWGQGYTGGAQFIVIKQDTDTGDRGIEADNDGTDPQAQPISMPTLANMTLISAGTSDGKSEQGIHQCRHQRWQE